MDLLCPLCNSTSITHFFSAENYPVFSVVYYKTKTEAQNCKRGNVKLNFCQTCGYIWNRNFDPSLLVYDESYTNSLHHSGFFQQYAESEVKELLTRWDLQNKNVLEIGCGKGDFLNLMAREAQISGDGFDSSYPGKDGETIGSNRFHKTPFSPKILTKPYHLAIARQVLEHISEPKAFLQLLMQTLSHDGLVYIEVPDTLHLLDRLSIWDVIYEHCSYYTKESLASAFVSASLPRPQVRSTFSNLNLVAESSRQRVEPEPNDHRRNDDMRKLSELVQLFSTRWIEKKHRLEAEIHSFAEKKERAVLWGAGARGSSFGVLLQNGRNIQYAVDLNPEKQGLFVAGSGAEVVAPEFLIDYQPHRVYIMNPVYQSEIEKKLQSLGVKTDVQVA